MASLHPYLEITFDEHAVPSVFQGLLHTFSSCQAQGPYPPPYVQCPTKRDESKAAGVTYVFHGLYMA